MDIKPGPSTNILAYFLTLIILDDQHETIDEKNNICFSLHPKVFAYCSLKVLDRNRKEILFFLNNVFMFSKTDVRK